MSREKLHARLMYPEVQEFMEIYEGSFLELVSFLARSRLISGVMHMNPFPKPDEKTRIGAIVIEKNPYKWVRRTKAPLYIRNLSSLIHGSYYESPDMIQMEIDTYYEPERLRGLSCDLEEVEGGAALLENILENGVLHVRTFIYHDPRRKGSSRKVFMCQEIIREGKAVAGYPEVEIPSNIIYSDLLKRMLEKCEEIKSRGDTGSPEK